VPVLWISVASWGQTPAASYQPPTYVLEPIATASAIYPASALEQKIQGEIEVQIVVSEAGDVDYAKASKGDAVLAKAAEDAAKKWRFKPVAKDGNPIPVVSQATFNFTLGNAAEGSKEIVPEIAPATDFPRRIRVSSGVGQGQLLSKTNPFYPPYAREMHIQGVVLLKALIGKDGAIASLETISGPPELVSSATDAVRKWRYRPYLLMGRPIEVECQIQVNFALQ